MTVEADLHSLIKNNAAFSALAGSRIYYVEAPQNTPEPYATFFRLHSERVHLFGADDSVVKAKFQFSCWGRTPNDVRALLEALRTSIQRYSGTGTVTIDTILIESDLDHPLGDEDDSETYHSSLDATVFYRE